MTYLKYLLLTIGALAFMIIFGWLPPLLASDGSAWWLLMYLVWPFVLAAYMMVELEGDDEVEKKIISLTKDEEGGTCLLCCEREATVNVKINRVKYNDNVIGFHVCDNCLSQMQSDIQKICE